MSAWQILTQGLLIINIKLLPFKNPGCVGELPLITVKKLFFHKLKNKRNYQEKLFFSQGNVMEMSGNFERTQLWQPCLILIHFNGFRK